MWRRRECWAATGGYGDLVRLAGKGWFRSWRIGLGLAETERRKEDRSGEERPSGGLLVFTRRGRLMGQLGEGR